MLEKIREIIAGQLNIDPEKINADTNFRTDLSADSLDLLELVMALEDEYEMNIPTEDLEKVETVGDVIEYLKNRGIE